MTSMEYIDLIDINTYIGFQTRQHVTKDVFTMTLLSVSNLGDGSVLRPPFSPFADSCIHSSHRPEKGKAVRFGISGDQVNLGIC